MHASAWEAGLAVARDYAQVHGHFLPPTSAVWGGDGFPVGVWAKNQRAGAKKARENAARRANGETQRLVRRGALTGPHGGPGRHRSRVGPGVGNQLGPQPAAAAPARPGRRRTARQGGRAGGAG
ncbi:hypothetical protein B1R27_23875 [Streptomyces sp. GKU 895]|nr:hypothetical protein B1R27_23875 [Streptomyces sp. GKU 895]